MKSLWPIKVAPDSPVGRAPGWFTDVLRFQYLYGQPNSGIGSDLISPILDKPLRQ